MYIPPAFRETDRGRIAALLERYPLACLVTVERERPSVSHLPLLYDPVPGPAGRILGHLARANPQSQHCVDGRPALAIFEGPHHYISPTWYQRADVPTWNYAVVHLSGTIRPLDDPEALMELLDRMTASQEAGNQPPWRADWQSESSRNLLSRIVGFEIHVTEIEAKFKLGQNRSREDQLRVRRHLASSDDPWAQALARLMADPERDT